MSDHANRLLQEATRLHRQGHRRQAIACYLELLTLRPQLTDCWYDLGFLLKAEGQFEHALAAYGEALTRGVRGAEEVHLNRAVILSDHLRRDDEAEQELETALRINHTYAPALLNLGNLHEERGRAQPAIECYQRVLELPREGSERSAEWQLEALARLANLSPPEQPDDPLLLRMQAALADPAGGDIARANLWFALGRARDRLGLYPSAFEAFCAGNRSASRGGPDYLPERAERLTDALIAMPPATTPISETNAEPAATSDFVPLFICGMFRSGSTLLEQVLSQHPQVIAGGELDLLPRMVAGPLAPFPASIAHLTPERAKTLATGYRNHLAQLFVPPTQGVAYISDKRPDNFQLIGLILRLLPDARIVHTTRNPLDNGLSVFMQHLDSRVAGYANSLAHIGHYYTQYRRLMAHWKQLYPDRIVDLDYDAFVESPRTALEPVLDFLQLDWDDRCLQFQRSTNTVKTASYWQVRRALYRESSGRWRHYQSQLAPLRQALRDAGLMDPE